MAEHEKRMDELRKNGMTVEPPTKEMAARMRQVTRPMWDEYKKNVPESAKIIEAFMAKTNKK
jgi:TRAP-type C4-dicarboxylate transport system substrate-binding protein